jgi:hypothetical protein
MGDFIIGRIQQIVDNGNMIIYSINRRMMIKYFSRYKKCSSDFVQQRQQSNPR